MRTNDELALLVADQGGVITRRQALDLGLTPEAIRHALRPDGPWRRIVRGVYATFTGPVDDWQLARAALLYAGSAAVVSGAFACRAYGLRYVPDDEPLLVIVPHDVQRAVSPVAVIRRTRAMPQHRLIRGIPMAPPERAVLDVCRSRRTLREVRALLCEAVQRRLTTPDRLLGTLGAAGCGSHQVRRVLDDLVVGCRSAPECELRDLLATSSALGEPLWNAPLSHGRGQVLVPDAAWPDARVVVEIDSAEWHRFGDRVEATERRRARYAALGWIVVPISPRRLRDDSQGVLGEIQAAVAAGRQRWVRSMGSGEQQIHSASRGSRS